MTNIEENQNLQLAMKISSARRSNSRRKVFPALLFSIAVAVGTSCEKASSKAESTNADSLLTTSVVAETSTTSKKNGAFSTYLELFPPSKSLEEWPEKSQWSLVANSDFFSNKSINSLIEKNYNSIAPEYHHLVPMGAVKRLDKYASEVKRPEEAFRWYAFQRIEQEGYTLTGLFAHKQNRNENDEYNAHPFLLVTYTASGKIIDQYVWWMIVDDDLQVWSDIAVHGDTFMVGHRPLPEEFAAPMDLVFKKVILNPSGKFQVVYSQDPEKMEE